MTKKTILLATATTVFLGVLSPAHAHNRGVSDGNDTASALDIASAKFSHTRRAYTGRVVTHDAFTNDVLGSSGEIYFDLDLAGRKGSDHYVWIDGSATSLVGKVYKKGRTQALGGATVKRVDAKTISFAFKKGLVSRKKAAVGFAARSRWQKGPDAYGVTTLLSDKTSRGRHRF